MLRLRGARAPAAARAVDGACSRTHSTERSPKGKSTDGDDSRDDAERQDEVEIEDHGHWRFLLRGSGAVSE